MRLFKTNVIGTHKVKVCQDCFDFDLAGIMIEKRRKTFLVHLDTLVCLLGKI